MRIVVDMDGTLCRVRQAGQTYEDVEPIQPMVQAVRKWHEDGHTIIIYTARHMATCDGDVDLVMDRIGLVTVKWLERHNVPFTELVFGKPYGDVYIDDRAVPFYESSPETATDVVNYLIRQCAERLNVG